MVCEPYMCIYMYMYVCTHSSTVLNWHMYLQIDVVDIAILLGTLEHMLNQQGTCKQQKQTFKDHQRNM